MNLESDKAQDAEATPLPPLSEQLFEKLHEREPWQDDKLTACVQSVPRGALSNPQTAFSALLEARSPVLAL